MVYEGQFDKPGWWVLFVATNQEKRVALHLKGRGIKHFLPCSMSARQWKDRRVHLEVPLFPGYVFVHSPFTPLTTVDVLTVPNVFRFLGTSKECTEVPESVIEDIRRDLEHGEVEPYTHLTSGQRVVITGGSMKGREGFLIRTRNSARVVISVSAIERSYAVEIDTDLIGAPPCSEESRGRSTAYEPGYSPQFMMQANERL